MKTTADRSLKTSPRSLLREGTLVVLAATLLNLALYAAARGLGATILLDPPAQEPNHLIVWFDVAWKTALPLVLGVAVLGLVRRSRFGLTALLIAVLVIFVPTSVVPAVVAHDAITSTTLLLFHLLPTAGFAVLALRVRQTQPETMPRAERSVST
ncbi:DUF6069 family protein [Nesterenkonia sp. HG001]|uniref:DUF6069 family protein n=1 Tax=Nesterenkonia sp. HG001 TaxID=2983207 RepID=UPI002AC47317|nr:DUF6069 family protein [Nesterenkonia sp. HG001]MDZ5077060.1 DUF6069 family protein [Nesterenkonia sp. HG001]